MNLNELAIRAHFLATKPATIEVPKNTNNKMIRIRAKMRKNFRHSDLYKLGPKLG